eukprot:COSAG02_NODE_1829_length_10738_cov_4.595827_8_plen_74_part_00
MAGEPRNAAPLGGLSGGASSSGVSPGVCGRVGISGLGPASGADLDSSRGVPAGRKQCWWGACRFAGFTHTHSL